MGVEGTDIERIEFDVDAALVVAQTRLVDKAPSRQQSPSTRQHTNALMLCIELGAMQRLCDLPAAGRPWELRFPGPSPRPYAGVMRRRPVVVAVCGTATAAVAGNAFISRDAMQWFGELKKPLLQIPTPGFIAVGATYYGIVGYVLARAVDRGDAEAVTLAGTVLVANEAWNALLFGRRSPGAACVGLLGFLVPLALLQRSVCSDERSRVALLPYTAWVIAYDLPWSYRLWRLNRPSRW